MTINMFRILALGLLLLVSCESSEDSDNTEQNTADNQKEKVEEQIAQKWKLVNIVTDAKQMDAQLDSLYQLQMNQIIEGSYLLFSKEGRFSEQIIEQHRKGAWSLDDDLKTLHLEFPNNQEDWKILSLSKDTIRLQARAKDGLLVEFTGVSQ